MTDTAQPINQTAKKPKQRNESTMTIRVDKDLSLAFQNVAKDNNRTASQLLRDYMQGYVKKHGQGDLFK